MKTVRLSLLMLVGLLVVGPQALRAQGLFFVTGLSHRGAAMLETVDGAEWELSEGRTVIPGTVRVTEGAQLMLFEHSGAVLIVLGPAALGVTREEIRDEIQLDLHNGKLVFASSREAGEGRAIAVSTTVSEQPRVSLDVLVGPGQTFVSRDADCVEVAYVADQMPVSILVRVNDTAVSLPSGQLLTMDGTGAYQVTPVGGWLTEQGFDQTWGRDLGVASAQVSRGDVETNLFNNIIAWDRYAGASYVAARLREHRFDPEIRQTVQTVTTPSRASTARTAIRTTVRATDALNEVPPLSPAGASVQNLREVGQGVTAIELNRQGRAYLVETGSRGLGFRGLGQLAIPGFQGSGGPRTLGPAGLGAQR